MSASRTKDVQPIACSPEKIEELCLMLGRQPQINEAGKPNLGMLQELEADIKRRRKGWIDVADGLGSRLALTSVGLVFGVPIAALWALHMTRGQWWSAPVVVGLIALVVWKTWSGRWKIRAAAKRIERRVCAGCAYVFDGLPACVIEGQARTFDFGPYECPECGMPWPLVPPAPPAALEIVRLGGGEDPY